jgi:2Fe-2S ferredoxin
MEWLHLFETVEKPMPRLVFVLGGGERRTVDVPERLSIMLAAIDNDIPGIVGECGGACACATCHVYVDPDHLSRLPAAGLIEREMLDGVAAPRRPESRLGCQIAMTGGLDGLVVHVPERQ